MPRLTSATPKYRRHKATGKAVVTLDGRDFYLGPYGTKASKQEYDRLIGEWIANHRRFPASPTGLTVVELAAAYLRHATAYYRKDGEPTGTILRVKATLRIVTELYGHAPAVQFGPLALQAIQQRLVGQQKSRRYINYIAEEIKRMFRWGASQELLPVTVYQSLATVPGLRRGRTEARECPPVLPVAETTANLTIPHLPPIVADMVRLQRLTGARPGEICTIRPCDVDTSTAVWAYRPESHKTQHHGRERVIFIGPQGQDVLRPYLLREKTSYCFCPAEAEAHRLKERHAARVTPIGYGNRPGTNRKGKPKRSSGRCYSTASYGQAIRRGCEIAFGMPDDLRREPKEELPDQRKARLEQAGKWRAANVWNPNQLRHSAGTAIRKRFGLEAAQVTLGHAAADVTQIYAERDQDKAAAVMLQVG